MIIIKVNKGVRCRLYLATYRKDFCYGSSHYIAMRNLFLQIA